MNTAKTIDEYIAGFPAITQQVLGDIRQTIKHAAPKAEEAIRYGMPTYRLNGKNMIHFAAFTHHIGLYATPHAHVEFEAELRKYKRGKGSVQFPLDEPIPMDLIKRIALFRAKQLTKGA